MTVDEFIEEIIRVFRRAGIECPESEAMLLACHVLSCKKSWLYLHKNDEMDDKVLLASAALIKERCKGRPIQYVIGTANFYGIDLAVDERVLIPRPETEGLVEEAIKELRTRPFPKVMDLCTGSGAIAAAVAANLPEARVVATELSPRAFMLARVNLKPYKNVQVQRGDLFAALKDADDPRNGARPFDAILTNPPYIPSGAIDSLAREVKDHEPRMALDGGADGLDIIRRIINEAPQYLKEGGLLLMEIGDDQGAEAVSLAVESGSYRSAQIIKDLAGKDRILRAQRI